jgi:hypothetical protein
MSIPDTGQIPHSFAMCSNNSKNYRVTQNEVRIMSIMYNTAGTSLCSTWTTERTICRPPHQVIYPPCPHPDSKRSVSSGSCSCFLFQRFVLNPCMSDRARPINVCTLHCSVQRQHLHCRILAEEVVLYVNACSRSLDSAFSFEGQKRTSWEIVNCIYVRIACKVVELLWKVGQD